MKLEILLKVTDDEGNVLLTEGGHIKDFEKQSSIKVLQDVKSWIGEPIVRLKVRSIQENTND